MAQQLRIRMVRSTKSEFRVERTVTMGNDMILVWD